MNEVNQFKHGQNDEDQDGNLRVIINIEALHSYINWCDI